MSKITFMEFLEHLVLCPIENPQLGFLHWLPKRPTFRAGMVVLMFSMAIAFEMFALIVTIAQLNERPFKERGMCIRLTKEII